MIAPAPPPVPVTILSGFLGAGKTTLLNRLLADPTLARTAVIVNEFGEIGLDHALIETSADGIIELSDGCLCCTVRGDLVDTLDRLLDGSRPIDRIVIETTGLADPVPVLQAVMVHPTREAAMRLDGVVTVVDAINGARTLDAYEEAKRQVALADRLVVSKAEPDSELDIALRTLNPGAPRLIADRLADPAEALLDCGLVDGAKRIAVDRWLRDDAHDHEHHHPHDVSRHGASIRSFALAHDRPIPVGAVEDFLDLLASAHGPRLLRMKGIVQVAEHPDEPLVLHAVQTVMHPPARLPAWPDANRRTRIVLIVDGIAEAWVRDLFVAFSGKPAIDRPDRAALTNNPLAIPGLS